MTEDGKPGPIPPGTRDVLPDEMRELRRIEAALTSEFSRSGYSEVSTPTIEYAELLGRGGRRGGPLYRFLDDRGELVALRNDMTVPIARLAAARLGEVAPPWRLSYLGSSFRTTSPRRADLRESGQAGIELIGPEDADGTAEVLTVLDRALVGVGISEVVICIGDASLWPSLLEESGLAMAESALCLEALARGDLVELEATLTSGASDLEERGRELVSISRTRGDVGVLAQLGAVETAASRASAARLGAVAAALEGEGLAAEIVFDLGMARDPDYYSGEVYEVYSKRLGKSIGGGGRYDGLLEQFGVELPAVGFSLSLERLHAALIEGPVAP